MEGSREGSQRPLLDPRADTCSYLAFRWHVVLNDPPSPGSPGDVPCGGDTDGVGSSSAGLWGPHHSVQPHGSGRAAEPP